MSESEGKTSINETATNAANSFKEAHTHTHRDRSNFSVYNVQLTKLLYACTHDTHIHFKCWCTLSLLTNFFVHCRIRRKTFLIIRYSFYTYLSATHFVSLIPIFILVHNCAFHHIKINYSRPICLFIFFLSFIFKSKSYSTNTVKGNFT